MLLKFCLATIGVCVFWCADFGWRTFCILRKQKGLSQIVKIDFRPIQKQQKTILIIFWPWFFVMAVHGIHNLLMPCAAH